MVQRFANLWWSLKRQSPDYQYELNHRRQDLMITTSKISHYLLHLHAGFELWFANIKPLIYIQCD